MQPLPALLLLLLCGVAAQQVKRPLKCHMQVRTGLTVKAVQQAGWESVHRDANRTYGPVDSVSCKSGWGACGHWLIYEAEHFPYGAVVYQDYYGGCYSDKRSTWDHRSQLVHKYCSAAATGSTNSSSPTCFSTRYYTYYLQHKPAYLCCCFSDLCETPEIYDLPELHTLLPQPPPPQRVTCEKSLRSARMASVLSNAEPEAPAELESCEAPCAEFVYFDAPNRMWRRWRAGCSYLYNETANYTDVVKQFCAAPSHCAEFDMIEPSTRAYTPYNLNFTVAFACCCSGTDCALPDTVAFSLGHPHDVTTAPGVTTASASASSDEAGTMPAEDGPVLTPAKDGPVVWPWLLLGFGVAVLLLILVIIIVAIVICIKKRKSKGRAAEHPVGRGAIMWTTAGAIKPASSLSGIHDDNYL